MIHMARSWTAAELSANVPADHPNRAFWQRLADLDFRINTLDGSGYTAVWNFDGRGFKAEANTMQDALKAALAAIDALSTPTN